MSQCCYAPPELWVDDTVTLPADEAHHISRVLRAAAGDSLLITDGCGLQAVGHITQCRKGHVVLSVSERRSVPAFMPELHLIQPLIRTQRMDWIIQKAVELGIQHIHPVRSDHAVVHLDNVQAEKKAEHWAGIAIAAMKQSNQVWLPQIHAVDSVCNTIDAFDGTLLYGDLSSSAQPLSTVLPSLHSNISQRAGLLLGPEGDFSPRERACFASKNTMIPVSLGAQIFRAETASIYLMCLTHYALRAHSERDNLL